MDRIIYTAGSGASQAMQQQSVVNHNLSNVSTPGFRAELDAMRAVPVQGDGRLATRTSVAATTSGTDFSPGYMNATGRRLDVAMQGDAFLAIQDPQGGEAYTRRGDLQVDADGMLTVKGEPVMGEQGPIVVPPDAEFSIGADGSISVLEAGANPDEIAPVGRLKLVTPDLQALTRGDDGWFRLPPGDDAEIAAPQPLDEDARLQSGVLEGSNVSATDAMVAMIDGARRYDMQMKVIESADQNAQRANSLLSVQA
ncbi:flagellar basal body rod protein FlgF [Chromohalobacter israelensis]|uniref:Flagellar basal-body rod protein FlgF n=1 Tax=Chromohalobacter israelensis (strain ATCC BAA-138 / DSM 3043 / CIP 106854 / NCIMB 13768 / 1H11) TaxID=290398 RepID=Q1QW32_CHRI1|nr:flagellar basal body rod protein FlgF [Chromohalobacter salexigens]ABE59326.1 Flagellar basal-body rod FlgF [Chromohalobacter salexigens DSM 3043]